MDDVVVKKTELVIKALDYAHSHKLDINDKDDVKKILEILDSEHTSEKEVEEFMNLLQNIDTFMEITTLKSDNNKKNLSN